MFCFNLSNRENVLLQIIVDAAWMCEVSSVSFMLGVIYDPTNEMGNQGLLMPVLQKYVLESSNGAL
jgi:hypothetical protein